MKNVNPYLFAIVILNVVLWTFTAVVACLTVRTSGNPWWSLLMIIPALCSFGYKEGKQ